MTLCINQIFRGHCQLIRANRGFFVTKQSINENGYQNGMLRKWRISRPICESGEKTFSICSQSLKFSFFAVIQVCQWPLTFFILSDSHWSSAHWKMKPRKSFSIHSYTICVKLSLKRIFFISLSHLDVFFCWKAALKVGQFSHKYRWSIVRNAKMR